MSKYKDQAEKIIKNRIEKPFLEVFGDKIDFIWNRFQRTDSSLVQSRHNTFSSFEKLLNRNFNFHFSIIVHYPEVTITNSLGRTHTIKDLYVKLEILPSIKFSGTRTTFTEKEWNSDYCHSHLPIKETFHEFCTMGSDDLKKTFADIQVNLYSLSKMDVMLLKEQLNAYVSWESIEGVPYRHISNIGLIEEVQLDNLYFDNQESFSIFDQNLDKIFLPLTINKDLKITNKEEISNILGEKIKNNEITLPTLIKIRNKYFTRVNCLNNIVWSPDVVLTFKGVDIVRNVIPEEDTQNYEYRPYPFIVDKLCNHWENRILQFLKKEYITNNKFNFWSQESLKENNKTISCEKSEYDFKHIINL